MMLLRKKQADVDEYVKEEVEHFCTAAMFLSLSKSGPMTAQQEVCSSSHVREKFMLLSQ